PSADHFTHLVGAIDRATVTEEEDDRFRISFANTGAEAGSALLAASLTVRDDWRAVAQDATVRTADGTLDITWTELTWTTPPADRVPATAFEIDRSLVMAPPELAPAPAVTPGATASLEIAALTALRRIDADLGEEVRVRRAD